MKITRFAQLGAVAAVAALGSGVVALLFAFLAARAIFHDELLVLVACPAIGNKNFRVLSRRAHGHFLPQSFKAVFSRRARGARVSDDSALYPW